MTYFYKMQKMKTYSILVLFLVLITKINGQSIEFSNDFIVNPKIEIEAKKHFSALSTNKHDSLGVFYNDLIAEYFQEDTLILSTRNTSSDNRPFKAFYYWRNDTLHIEGGFGFFSIFGFSVQVNNNKAKVNHLLSSDKLPSYKFDPDDIFRLRLEVPCHNSKFELSSPLEKIKNQTIYGLVEFESGEYYQIHRGVLKKSRMNMTIYFKAEKMLLN